MHIVDFVERFVFKSSRAKFALVLLCLIVAKSGVWSMPNLDASRRLAENPFVNPFSNPETHYLVWNWLSPWLAHVLSATDPVRFFLLHLAFAAAFSCLVVWLCFSRLDDRNARVALILFALLPVSATAYFWVGMDGLTLLLMVLSFLFPRNLLWPLAMGLLLGAQHFEQALVASALLCAVVVMRRYVRLRSAVSPLWVVALAAGVLAGKFLLTQFFEHLDLEVQVQRFYWVKQLFPTVLRQLVTDFHYTVWSVLAVGWFVLLKDVERGRAALPLLVGLFGAMGLLALVFDQTRVVAIVSFPVLWVSWLQDRDFLEQLENRFVAWIATGWLIVPWAWVLGGQVQRSVLPFDLFVLTATLTGWIELPRDLSWWPFRYEPPGR